MMQLGIKMLVLGAQGGAGTVNNVANQVANFGEYTAAGAGGFQPLDDNSQPVSLTGTPTLASGSAGAYTAQIVGGALSFTGGGDGAPDGSAWTCPLGTGGAVVITIAETAGEAHVATTTEFNTQCGKASATAAASGGKSGLTAKLRPGTYEQFGNQFNGDFVWHAGTGFTIESEVLANKARLQSGSATQSVFNVGASTVTGSTYGKVTLRNVEIYGYSETFTESFGANFVSRYQELNSAAENNVYLVEIGIGNNPVRDLTIENVDFIGNKTDRPWTATPSNPPVQYVRQIVGWITRLQDVQRVTIQNCTFRYMDTGGNIGGDDWTVKDNWWQYTRADMLRMGTLTGASANGSGVTISGNLLTDYWTTHRFHPDWFQVFGGSYAVDAVDFVGNILMVNEAGAQCPPRDTSVNTGAAQAWGVPITANGAIPAREGTQFPLDLTSGNLALTLPDTATRPASWTVDGSHLITDDTIALTGGTGSFTVGDTVLISGRHFEVLSWDGTNLEIAGNLQAYSGGEAVNATTYHLNLQAYGLDGGNTATITASGSDTIYDEDAAQTVASLTIGNNGPDWDNVRVRMDEPNSRWLVGRNNSGFTAYQGVYQFNQAATFNDHLYAYNIGILPGQAIRAIQGSADATNWMIANNTFAYPIVADYIDAPSTTSAIIQIDVASVTGPFDVVANYVGDAGSNAKFDEDTSNVIISDQAGSGSAQPQAIWGGSGSSWSPGGSFDEMTKDQVVAAIMSSLRPITETGVGALAADASEDKWDFLNGTTNRDTPPHVVNLTVTPQAGGAGLSWRAPVYQEDYTVTGYDVDVRVNGGSWTALATAQVGTTYSDTSQSAGDSVEYQVRAVNSQGDGPNIVTDAITVLTPSLQDSNALTTTSTTHTHSAVGTGTATANDLIVVTLGARMVSASGQSVTGITIGGQPMTIAAQAMNGANTLALVAAFRDTGALIGGAEDVVVTYSQTSTQSAISVHRIAGISSATPVATDTDTAGGDLSLTGLSNAFVACSMEGWDVASGSLTFTVTGLTKNAEQAGYEASANRSTNASLSGQAVSGSLTITGNNDNFESEVFVAAAFE